MWPWIETKPAAATFLYKFDLCKFVTFFHWWSRNFLFCKGESGVPRFFISYSVNIRAELCPSTVNSRLADTPIKRTAAKSQAKTNYRRLTEINSRYYGLSLIRTLIRSSYSVRNKGSWLYTFCLGVTHTKVSFCLWSCSFFSHFKKCYWW